LKKNKIFISAYSKLPKGISATELYTKTAMAIIIDRNTGKIYDVECTLATEVAKRYIKNILTNKNINQIDSILQEIDDNYFGNAKKAVMAVLTNCYKRYRLICGSFDEDN
jgi:hypothetical protein